MQYSGGEIDKWQVLRLVWICKLHKSESLTHKMEGLQLV